MSITLITGIPGGGKSYWAVNAILFRKLQEKYVIYHNITGLRDEFVDTDAVKRWTDFTDEREPGGFFTRVTQEKLCKQVQEERSKPVLIIIDEAGAILGKEDPEVFRWLSWHRHLGQDVWIIVQDAGMIARSYRKLAEIEIRGVKNGIINHFLYSHRAGKTEFKLERLSKNEAVFAAYESFTQAGAKKGMSFYIPGMIGVFVAAVALLTYVIGWAAPNMMSKGIAGSGKQVASSPVAPPSEKPPGPSGKGKGPKRKGPEVSYTLAGLVGGKVLMQTSDGRLVGGDEVFGRYTIVESSGSSVTVVSEKEGSVTISKKTGFVKVAPTTPGVGGRAPSSPGGVGAKKQNDEGVSDG
jgi:hypothetical protein